MDIFFFACCDQDDWFVSKKHAAKKRERRRIAVVDFGACNLRKKEPLQWVGFTKTL
jgi:hypothetical protein